MTASNSERCDIEIEPGRTIVLVPEPNRERLNEQERADYRDHRYRFVEWLLNRGKRPERAEGYSEYTAYETAYRTARLDRWTWTRTGGYTVPPRPEHATRYIEEDVIRRDVTAATKGKIEEAVARYMRWASISHGIDDWEHDQVFSSGGNDAPRDYLTRRERRQIREAALARGDGWKLSSLVLTSLDAALRPVEVRRARPEWVDVDNKLLRIPRDDASKSIDNWRVSITDRTATALGEWLDERNDLDVYGGRDELWLTREGTAYTSRSLARLLRSLFDDAGIDDAGRSLTWYSIRHSTGTYMTDERDLKAAKDQLRHQSAQTTMKYDQVPVEDRRDALDRM